ncbi:MAG: hypothetical protein ABIJ59_16170 [Pseudomonadota bacterium]
MNGIISNNDWKVVIIIFALLWLPFFGVGAVAAVNDELNSKMKIINILIIALLFLNCNCSKAGQKSNMPSEENSKLNMIKEGCYLIDRNRHEKLNTTPYNPAQNGQQNKNRFSDNFASEISDIMECFSNYFNKHGKYGKLERYGKESSDWWIDSDFYSTSRVLFIDLLNPKLQDYKIIQGAQNELAKLQNNWMLMIGHNNEYDALGNYVGKPGEYYFWITKQKIEIYSEREEDILIFIKSIKNPNKG